MDFSGVGRWEWMGGGTDDKAGSKNRKKKTKAVYCSMYSATKTLLRQNENEKTLAPSPQVRSAFSKTTILAPSKRLCFFVLEARGQGGVGFCYDKVCECR